MPTMGLKLSDIPELSLLGIKKPWPVKRGVTNTPMDDIVRTRPDPITPPYSAFEPQGSIAALASVCKYVYCLHTPRLLPYP